MNDHISPGLIPCRDAFELKAASGPVEELGKRAGEALVGAIGDFGLDENKVFGGDLGPEMRIPLCTLIEVVGAVMGQACIATTGGHPYGDPAKEWLTTAIAHTVQKELS